MDISKFNQFQFKSNNVVSIIGSVGDRFKICQPLHYPPAKLNTYNNNEKISLAGFTLLDPTVGQFEGMVENSNMCVYYRHLRKGRQIIQYVSKLVGEYVFYIIIDGILVHDHSTIAQGGPAYATYYSRIPQEEEEEM